MLEIIYLILITTMARTKKSLPDRRRHRHRASATAHTIPKKSNSPMKKNSTAMSNSALVMRLVEDGLVTQDKGGFLTQLDAEEFFLDLIEQLPEDITASISGRMTTRFTCTECNGRYSDNQPVCRPLVIGIHLNPDVDDLVVGLEQQATMDHAEGRCPLCNTFTRLDRKVEYRYIGDRVTIFRLIRFSFTGSGSKIGHHVAFPLIHNENYHLRSIIVHQGRSLHSGHYYALVKRDDQWFKVNDEMVSRVTESYVLRQKAYLLFYVKVNKAEDEAEAKDEEKIEAEAKAEAEEKVEEKAGAKAEAEERADAEDEPVGIKNKNNSCFINATMQSLASLPSFVRDFKDSDDRGEYGELLQDFINW